jgi:hypothetical protein
MKTKTFIGIFFIIAVSCGQQVRKTTENMNVIFTEFINKEKFNEDISIFYPGVSDIKMKPILTEKINEVAGQFEKVANDEHPTNKKYQEVIKQGLILFSDLELDTEDRERIGLYFEELMDIVGLESSDGQLNRFIYE